MKSSGANAYLATKVNTANPAELRLMLFDGAIRFAQQARTGISDKNFESAYTGITRCQQILMELINSLRPEQDPDLCRKLAALYTYMFTQLMKASSERNVAIIDEVLHLLQFERETWQMLLDQLAAENKAAASMPAAPLAQPAIPPLPSGAAQSIVGANLSLRG